MAHPVTVYDGHPDQGGRVVKVITSAMLEKRSDAALALQTTSAGYSNSFIPTERKCKPCGTVFWAALRGKKYCSTDCSRKAFKTGAKRRAQLKKAAAPSA
ncbi:MAG: hypothetical protein IIA63_05920 [Nitrospinae bacterium]|nr:hypothetical protein [Nitrospinota bacterium]